MYNTYRGDVSFVCRNVHRRGGHRDEWNLPSFHGTQGLEKEIHRVHFNRDGVPDDLPEEPPRKTHRRTLDFLVKGDLGLQAQQWEVLCRVEKAQQEEGGNEQEE